MTSRLVGLATRADFPPANVSVLSLDREVLRALVSLARVEILKLIGARRRTATDLSRTLGLAKATVLEHLRRLVAAGLVRRVDDGRKWVYYELTGAGRRLVPPTP